jgi:hypothetical protein
VAESSAWSREAARQCQRCALTRAQPPAGSEVQGRRASKRAAAWRAQREEQKDSSGECEGRQLEQVLCPRGCECGNALAASGSPEVVQVVQGGGGELAAKGVMAIQNIEQGAIITCFGNSASVRAGPAGDELQFLINELEPSDTLKDALKWRGPPGVGHFIDHSCCPLHTNAELAVRW